MYLSVVDTLRRREQELSTSCDLEGTVGEYRLVVQKVRSGHVDLNLDFNK